MERPILFRAPDIRAILEGRKTQTRRIVKCGFEVDGDESGQGFVPRSPCPYGLPGDRLWVRETWGQVSEHIVYRADADEYGRLNYGGLRFKPKWKPSIFMPRDASRITLRVVGVRVEQLQDISEEDAKAEGVTSPLSADTLSGGVANYGLPVHFTPYRYAHGFRFLWEQINGADSWNTNPWVWVIDFEREAA